MLPETPPKGPWNPNRVELRNVNGHEFGLRRPSEADNTEILTRYSRSLADAGVLAADLLAGLHGEGLLWHARFEVLLLPRRNRRGEEVKLGEAAPTHWIEEIKSDKGELIARIVSFEGVDPEEFQAAREAFADVFEPKKKD